MNDEPLSPEQRERKRIHALIAAARQVPEARACPLCYGRGKVAVPHGEDTCHVCLGSRVVVPGGAWVEGLREASGEGGVG